MSTKNAPKQLEIQTLWAKYEDITMHFNEMLIQLRLRSLAGIAAVSTLVGIFADNAVGDVSLSWLVAAFLFTAMAFIWIAIFCLDFFYYNRLLSGAVEALKQIEEDSKAGAEASAIYLSTKIIDEFKDGTPTAEKGVAWFYGIVLGFLIIGALASVVMYATTPSSPAAASERPFHQNPS